MIKARPAESYVMVLSPQTPTILLNGSSDAARDYAHFRAGLPVFPDLEVKVLSRDRDSLRGKWVLNILKRKQLLKTETK